MPEQSLVKHPAIYGTYGLNKALHVMARYLLMAQLVIFLGVSMT